MTMLAYTRTGAGAPLILLHGIGSSRHAWDPVLPGLAERFDVIAVDLPGFGDSAPLPPGVHSPMWRWQFTWHVMTPPSPQAGLTGSQPGKASTVPPSLVGHPGTARSPTVGASTFAPRWMATAVDPVPTRHPEARTLTTNETVPTSLPEKLTDRLGSGWTWLMVTAGSW